MVLPVFFIVYGANTVFSIMILIYSAINFHGSSHCPVKYFLYVFYMTTIPIYLLLNIEWPSFTHYLALVITGGILISVASANVRAVFCDFSVVLLCFVS